MQELMTQLSVGYLSAGTIVVWVCIAFVLGVLGGVLGGLKMGGKEIGHDLAAMMGALFGPAAGVPAVVVGLLFLFCMKG